MNKKLADQIGNDCKFALETIAKKYNMKLRLKGGIFTTTDFSPKFTFDEPLSVIETPINPYSRKEITDVDIKGGWAPRGTKIKLNDGAIGIIIKSRSKKYLIDINGKEYVAHFSICSLYKG